MVEGEILVKAFEKGVKALITGGSLEELYFKSDNTKDCGISVSYSKQSKFKIRSNDLGKDNADSFNTKSTHPSIITLYKEILYSLENLILYKGYKEISVSVVNKGDYFYIQYKSTGELDDLLLVSYKSYKDFNKGSATIRDVYYNTGQGDINYISKLSRGIFIYTLLPSSN